MGIVDKLKRKGPKRGNSNVVSNADKKGRKKLRKSVRVLGALR